MSDSAGSRHPATVRYSALPADPVHTPQPDARPVSVGGALRRRWKLVAGCVVLATAAAVAVTSFLPRRYEAAATIRIDEQQSGMLPIDAMERPPRGSDVSTEIEALRSRTLAESVIDSLGMRLSLTTPRRVPRSAILADVRVDSTAPDGSFRLLREQGGRFRIDSGERHVPLAVEVDGRTITSGGFSFRLTPLAEQQDELQFTISSVPDVLEEMREDLTIDRTVRDANVVTVSYRNLDPKLARDVPNAIAAQFIDRRQSVRQREARSTVRFLGSQIERISAQLKEAENSLRAYRVGQRVVNPEEEGRSQITRMAEVQAQLGQLDAERSSLAQLLHEVDSASNNRRTGGSPYRDLVAFPSLLRNQATSQLLSSLSVLEDRRSELLTRRSTQDPDVKQISDRIAELEQQLRSLTSTYLRGLTNQVNALRDIVTQSSARLELLPAREIEFARLDRESTLLGNLYTLLQTRLKEAEIAAASEDARVQLLDVAALPRRPVSPKPALNAALGVLVGLLLGIGAASVREHVDRSVRSREELGAVTGVQVLGIIPHLGRTRSWLRRPADSRTGARLALGRPREVVSEEGTASASSIPLPTELVEAYNRLEANVTFARRMNRSRTLLVTSALPGEGKTTVATNLALVSAERGARVLLIDADLRRGVLDSLFGCPRSPGLSDVLDGTIPLSEAYGAVDVEGGNTLHFLTAGSPPANPTQLLSSRRLDELIVQVSSEFDLVIFDTPPINVVADVVLLATACESVLIVARSGITTLDALTFAMEQLRHVRVPVTGAVLNDVQLSQAGAYAEAYDYYATASPHVADPSHSRFSRT